MYAFIREAQPSARNLAVPPPCEESFYEYMLLLRSLCTHRHESLPLDFKLLGLILNLRLTASVDLDAVPGAWFPYQEMHKL